MKTRVLLAISLAAGLTVIWSCTTTSTKSSQVVTDDCGIVLRATPLNEQDQARMDQILARYDSELYKIDTHVNGMFKKRHGTLKDIFTEKALAASIAQDLHKQGFTRSAVRVGKYTASGEECKGAELRRRTRPSATPVGIAANPQKTSEGPPGSNANPQRVQQAQLVSELMPILQKYNQ